MKQLTKIENLIAGIVDRLNPILLLSIRLFVGVVFAIAGFGKFQNLEKTAEFFQNVHIPLAHIQAPFVAGVEMLFGIFILIGFLTRISAVMLSATMTVAVLVAHRGDLMAFETASSLTALLYLIILVGILVTGPGSISVDKK